MIDKNFILQRICVFLNKKIDPMSDIQVKEALNSELGIKLPQKRTFDESLTAANSSHEVIALITKYRNLN